MKVLLLLLTHVASCALSKSFQFEYVSHQTEPLSRQLCSCSCQDPNDELLFEYEVESAAQRNDSDLQSYEAQLPRTSSEHKKTPLQGNCERTCLKLNLVYDGGFSPECDESNAFNEFPYCDGDPAVDDRFHMRQCIQSCRVNISSDEECPQIHERGNDERGCKAGKAFRKGLPYEFETRSGDVIVIWPLVEKNVSTFQMNTSLNTTFSPTLQANGLNGTVKDEIFSHEQSVTRAPSRLATFRPTKSPSLAPSSNSSLQETFVPSTAASPSSNPTVDCVHTPWTIAMWVVLLLIILVGLGCVVALSVRLKYANERIGRLCQETQDLRSNVLLRFSETGQQPAT